MKVYWQILVLRLVAHLPGSTEDVLFHTADKRRAIADVLIGNARHSGKDRQEALLERGALHMALDGMGERV